MGQREERNVWVRASKGKEEQSGHMLVVIIIVRTELTLISLEITFPNKCTASTLWALIYPTGGQNRMEQPSPYQHTITLGTITSRSCSTKVVSANTDVLESLWPAVRLPINQLNWKKGRYLKWVLSHNAG